LSTVQPQRHEKQSKPATAAAAAACCCCPSSYTHPTSDLQ
jgi:hypothetical protein